MRIEGTRNRWVWYLEHVEIIGIETALGYYVEALSRLRAAPAIPRRRGAVRFFLGEPVFWTSGGRRGASIDPAQRLSRRRFS
ncbi:hypothetical protein JCM18918_2419 [Cutibacterium acnes JCM 18918]|nr:hypothetical protein JCM18918_2419 [Cutibacterium acnes JCM 18918]